MIGYERKGTERNKGKGIRERKDISQRGRSKNTNKGKGHKHEVG